LLNGLAEFRQKCAVTLVDSDEKVRTEENVEIVKLRSLIFANEAFENCEQVTPILVYLGPLRPVAAVLDLELVEVEAPPEFIQVGRIRV
jgi:hypothetical protein